MRWSPHNETLNVTALTANTQSILSLDDRGRFFELDRTGRVVTESQWPGATALTLRGENLFVADTSERLARRACPARSPRRR